MNCYYCQNKLKPANFVYLVCDSCPLKVKYYNGGKWNIEFSIVKNNTTYFVCVDIIGKKCGIIKKKYEEYNWMIKFSDPNYLTPTNFNDKLQTILTFQ
jgi:hypothetical protein